MTPSTSDDHTENQSAAQPEHPTTGHYEPYQWGAASQPTTDAPASDDTAHNAHNAHPGEVGYMWAAPSQRLSDERNAEVAAPTPERDPREAPTSIPGATISAQSSGPLPGPTQSGPLGDPRGERKRPNGFILAAGGCLVALAVLIALCAMSLGVVTALAAVSQPATATTTRTLHVSGAPTLQLHTDAASVNITGDPTDSDTVTVALSVNVKTISHNGAQSIVQAIKLTTTQSGNIININLRDSNNIFNPQVLMVRNVTLDITAPTHTGVSGELNAGALTTDDLTGALNITSNAGAVTLHRMTFTGASSMRLSAGGLTFDGALAQGATVDATVNAGGVVCTLPSQTGAHLNASVNSGSVSVIGWNANITRNVTNASTIADVGAHPTGSLTIRVNAGSVIVTLA